MLMQLMVSSIPWNQSITILSGHFCVNNGTVANRNELIIQGELGRIRVNRGGISGKPVEDLAKDKAGQDWMQGEIQKLYRGKRLNGHMQNFFDCIKDRSLPVSDVFTHHRSVSVCHLANIAMLLERPLKWDPEQQNFLGDKQANAKLTREQRKPFEIQI